MKKWLPRILIVCFALFLCGRFAYRATAKYICYLPLSLYFQGSVYPVGETAEEIATSFVTDLMEGNFVNLRNSYRYVRDPWLKRSGYEGSITYKSMKYYYETLQVDTSTGKLEVSKPFENRPRVFLVRFPVTTYIDKSYQDNRITWAVATVMLRQDLSIVHVSVSW